MSNTLLDDPMPGLTSLLGVRTETTAGGKRALILDSTQLVTFDTCPMAWKYSDGEQLELIPKREPGMSDKRAMVMGTYGHKLLEIYYKSRASNLTQSQSADAAHAFDTDLLEDALHPDDIDAVRRQFTLYTYTYAARDVTPNSPDSVEVGFSTKIHEDSDWIFILEGRIDLMGTLDNQPVWVDHKFQLRRHDLYNRSIQFRNYSLATEMTMGIVNYIRLTKEVSKDTFVRGILSFSKYDMEWWRGELIAMFTRAAGAVASDTYPQHWSSCSGIYGHPCNFTELCEERNTTVRDAKKESLYQIKRVWKPW